MLQKLPDSFKFVLSLASQNAHCPLNSISSFSPLRGSLWLQMILARPFSFDSPKQTLTQIRSSEEEENEEKEEEVNQIS